MLQLTMARDFEQVEVADQVGLDIGMGVLDRIAYPGLGTQVNHAADLLPSQRGVERSHVGKVDLVKGEAIRRLGGQRRQPVTLQGDRVVIVEVVDADDAVAPRRQQADQVKANEAGRAGNENTHEGSLSCRVLFHG